MLSRNLFAAATAFSLALHMGLLFGIPRNWTEAAGEDGREKMVVSFGMTELPAVDIRPEDSVRRQVFELPDIVDVPVMPAAIPEETLVEPDSTEELQDPLESSPIEKTTRDPDAPASVPAVLSDNKTPGSPNRTNGAAADARTRFLADVVAMIQKAKRYPAKARRTGIEGTARIEFVLSAQGKVLSARLVASSGCVSLDNEGLAMISRAAPYPRIPEELGLAEIKLVLPIAFELKSAR